MAQRAWEHKQWHFLQQLPINKQESEMSTQISKSLYQLCFSSFPMTKMANGAPGHYVWKFPPDDKYGRLKKEGKSQTLKMMTTKATHHKAPC